MTIRPTIDRAGKYPVVQTPCPDFAGELVDLTAPRAGILHTTEGAWNPSMGVFRVHFAPHFIVGLNPQGVAEIAQLVPVGVIGAACRAHNNKAIIEIEMVGNSLETPWLPDPATLDALAALMVVCRDEWGIPLTRPWADGDYGRAGHNPHRSSGKFGTVAGWFGHADMPDPDSHWDPGNLRWADIFAHAAGLSIPPVPDPNQPPITPAHDGFWLQRALNMLKAKGTPLAVDGDVGPKTKKVLSDWEISHGLYGSNGIITPALVTAINTALDGALKTALGTR